MKSGCKMCELYVSSSCWQKTLTCVLLWQFWPEDRAGCCERVCLMFGATAATEQRKRCFSSRCDSWPLLCLSVNTSRPDVSARAWTDMQAGLCLLTCPHGPTPAALSATDDDMIRDEEFILWQETVIFSPVAVGPPFHDEWGGVWLQTSCWRSAGICSLPMMSKPKHPSGNSPVSFLDLFCWRAKLIFAQDPRTRARRNKWMHSLIQTADVSRCFLNGWKAGKLLAALP